uniref:KAP NTPase domain-containing protein n=1 Tax=Chaetoceros debilis TaxID=122233 RepID=A0A6S8UCV2_9STRA
MMKKTLDENFRDHLLHKEKILANIKSAPPISIFLIALFIAVFFGAVFVWLEFGDVIMKWLVGIIPSSLIVVFTAVLKWWQHVTAQTKEITAQFSDNVNKLKVQGAVSDIETAFTNESTTEIQKELKKISEIKKRLKILEGESMHDVVRDRVESDVYLSKLGPLHQVKEDLDRLSESMFNKYDQEVEDRKRHSDIELKKREDETIQQELEPFINSQPHLQIDLQKSKNRKDSNRFPVVTYGDFTFWALHYTSTTTPRCSIGPIHLLKGKESTKNGWLVVGINHKKKEFKTLKKWDDEPNGSTTLGGISMNKGLKRCIFTFVVKKNKKLRVNEGEIEREIDFDYLIHTKEGYKKLLQNDPKVRIRIRKEEEGMDEEAITLLKSTEGIFKRDMFPRGKPRIFIFIDDLDRTDPDKILDVLEAMQLLASTPLFVIVAAIDSRYVCLSLEHKERYNKILRSNQSPTGMDFLEKIFQASYRLPTILKIKWKNLYRAKLLSKMRKSAAGLLR